jgi:hypothetical protein
MNLLETHDNEHVDIVIYETNKQTKTYSYYDVDHV